MNKLNNKGFGHHLLLIAVTTLAVLGAAGFFVWNRQKDKGIDAKAAGYDYQTTAEAGMGAQFSEPYAAYYACSLRIGTTSRYTVNTKLVLNRGTSTKGYIKIGNSIVQTLNLTAKGTVTGTKTFTDVASLTFAGEWTIDATLPFREVTITAKDLMPCNKSALSANYKYKLYASTEPLDAIVAKRNIAYYACKIVVGNKFALDTKLEGLAGYPAVASALIPYAEGDIYIGLSTGGMSNTRQFSWPRQLLNPGTILPFGGSYLKLDGSVAQLFAPIQFVKIDDVPNCI